MHVSINVCLNQTVDISVPETLHEESLSDVTTLVCFSFDALKISALCCEAMIITLLTSSA